MRLFIVHLLALLMTLSATSFPAVAGTQDENRLTLHFYPSPGGVDWRSPKDLAWSVLWNTAVNLFTREGHPIGHVSVELQCGKEATPVYAGMVNAEKNRDKKMVFLEHAGLGVLFHNFKGKLETETEIVPDLKKRYEAGNLSWISFEISPATCQRLLKYHAEYRDRQVGKYYGLPNRPRYQEGSGCSAFGASFLELAGILNDEFRQAWSMTVRVPKGLIGTAESPVWLTRVLFSDLGKRWANEDEPHQSVSFWDPDLMHQWAMATWQRESKNPSGRYRLEKRGNAPGLIVDVRNVPTPSEPIWREIGTKLER